VGIMADVCVFLAKNEINILDVTQTIVDGFFNMMMITDFSNTTKEFSVLEKEFLSLMDSIGVKAQMQKEEIFDFMHRI
jgi:ACT domain-containing protein